MQLSRLFVMSVLFGSALVAACGDDGGKSGGGVDAPKQIDAPTGPLPDAPAAGLTGLGQHCDPAMMNADCPTEAPKCIGLSGGTATYCTPDCLTNGTATTNAQGQITATMPAPSTTACMAAYHGTIAGAGGACGVILAYMPMDANLMPNKQYTGIELGCVLKCGTAGDCPTGFTANGAGAQCVCI
jgi:hypothetical protein